MVITKEFLEQYSYLESEIKRIRRTIKKYREHPLLTEHSVVKGSMNRFPYTECRFAINAPNLKSQAERKKIMSRLIVDLKGNEQLYEDMKLEIEIFIERIPDLSEKTILVKRYVEGLKLEDIGDELQYSKSAISKKIDKIIEKYKVETNSTS